MSHQQLQPWHVFSGIFLAFWIMMSYFDNFFVTLVLCVGGGFATDNLNKYMKGPQGEFDDDQDQELQEPPTDCDFVCPDKPLPPEPPMSSNDVSEDELENANEVEERTIPEQLAMTSSSNNSSSFKSEYEHQKEAILEEEKREELDFKELLVQNYDQKDLESSLLPTSDDFQSESNGNLIEQQQVNLLACGATFKQQSQEPEWVPSQVSEEVQEVLPYGVNDINDKGIDLMKSEPLEPVEVLDASSEFFRESPDVPEVTESPQDIIIPENLQKVSEVPEIPVVPESSEEPIKMHAKTPSPDLMEAIEEPPAPLDLIEQLEAQKYDHSVIMETVEPIMKSQNNPTPPPSPSEDKTSTTTSEAKTQDLLVDFLSTHQPPPPTEEKEASESSFTEFETVPKEIQSDSLETSLITEAAGVGIDSSLVEHVAATSLEQHEQELANLLKEAQRDDDSPVKELEDFITQKDEGDPWVLDENPATDMLQQEGQQQKEEFPFPEEQRLGSSSSSEAVRGSAGEALVHLGDSNDDMANKDDISHCAVFGDENEPDDLELDEDEKQPHRGSTGTGSSDDSSSSEGPDEEKPVMLEPTKSTTADTTAPSSGHDVDDDDDLSSSSEEADNLHRPQTPPNSANSTSHDLAFDMGKHKYDDCL